jgi:hypothetical protein
MGDVFKKTLAHEGLRGFYKGLVPNLSIKWDKLLCAQFAMVFQMPYPWFVFPVSMVPVKPFQKPSIGEKHSNLFRRIQRGIYTCHTWHVCEVIPGGTQREQELEIHKGSLIEGYLASCQGLYNIMILLFLWLPSKAQ